MRLILAVAASVGMPAAVQADITLDVLHAWPSHSEFLEPLAEAFMQAHPDIKINFRASPEDYQQAHLAVVRGSLTGDLPDVYLAGYSVLGPMVSALEPRGQTVPLEPFLEKEGADWVTGSYADAVLALGQVNGVQYGIPFNASTPIIFYNADLAERAGADPDNFPTSWDGVIALAKDIDALGDSIGGMDYSVGSIPGDWFFQSVLLERGADIVSADGSAAGFDDQKGLDALRFIRHLAVETNMDVATTPDPYRQQFFAGQLGMLVASPSGVSSFTEAVGDRFDMRTARYPVADPETGGLPTGGNAMAILAQDPERQAAAWEYVKFMTGAEAQAAVVRATGYMPTNKKSAEALHEFFAENPNYATVVGQMDLSRPWYSYPGTNGVEIWRAQREIVDQVQRGNLTPEEGLEQIVKVTNELIE